MGGPQRPAPAGAPMTAPDAGERGVKALAFSDAGDGIGPNVEYNTRTQPEREEFRVVIEGEVGSPFPFATSEFAQTMQAICGGRIESRTVGPWEEWTPEGGL